MTVRTGASESPDFLLHSETCHSCFLVSLVKHTGMEGGRAPKESPGETEQSRNPAAASHWHVEGVETAPETRCGDN